MCCILAVMSWGSVWQTASVPAGLCVMARILFVNLEGAVGGAETSLLLMAKYLRSEFLVSVACPPNSALARALDAMRAERHKLPYPPRGSYRSLFSLPYWLRTSLCLMAIALRAKPDVIHANSFRAGTASLLAATVARKRLLSHARDLAGFALASRFCGWFCRKVIAVSNAVRDSLISRGIHPRKIEVVYNGVDNALGERAGAAVNQPSPATDCDEPSFVFGHVGQFVPWKNHLAFLQAASRVARELPRVGFVIAGDDLFGRNCAYKRAVLGYAENSDIAERISFLGWQEDMQKVWRGIDCLVHTAAREPFGRVIVEAMAHKIPVIAVDACGPHEIIENGRTGILVEAGDIEGLSGAMLQMARDRESAGKLANAAYENVMSNFTAERTAEKVREIYTEILAE